MKDRPGSNDTSGLPRAAFRVPEPLRQLRRLVRVCGVDLPTRLLDQALSVESAGGLSTKDGSRRRTLGGVFFRLARDHLHASDRAAFFRVFQQPRSRPARVPWTDRPRRLGPSTAGKGEVKNVKITVT
jgi:hypothetical protein